MTKAKQLPHHTAEFRGYTLDEIRYMRAYTAARIEINKDRLNTRIHDLSKASKNGFVKGGIAGRMLGALSYIDMAVIAWKIGSKALKLVRTVRR